MGRSKYCIEGPWLRSILNAERMQVPGSNGHHSFNAAVHTTNLASTSPVIVKVDISMCPIVTTNINVFLH